MVVSRTPHCLGLATWQKRDTVLYQLMMGGDSSYVTRYPFTHTIQTLLLTLINIRGGLRVYNRTGGLG